MPKSNNLAGDNMDGTAEPESYGFLMDSAELLVEHFYTHAMLEIHFNAPSRTTHQA